jgi:hypothetical protein
MCVYVCVNVENDRALVLVVPGSEARIFGNQLTIVVMLFIVRAIKHAPLMAKFSLRATLV